MAGGTELTDSPYEKFHLQELTWWKKRINSHNLFSVNAVTSPLKNWKTLLSMLHLTEPKDPNGNPVQIWIRVTLFLKGQSCQTWSCSF